MLSLTKTIDSFPPEKSPELISANYPFKAGNQWLYLNRDNLGGSTDTLAIFLSNIWEQDNQKVGKLYLRQWGMLVDSAQLIQISKFLEYKEYDTKVTNYSWFGNFNLVFPIYKGAKAWVGPKGTGDSFRVVGYIDSMNVNGRKFKKVFSIKREYISPNDGSIVQLLFVCTDVGIVRESLNVNIPGIPPQSNSLSLLSYEIK